MGRLLFLAGGYICSWMVTNDPGVTLPPHRGRVSGTQGQPCWVLLLLGTAGPPTPGPRSSIKAVLLCVVTSITGDGAVERPPLLCGGDHYL